MKILTLFLFFWIRANGSFELVVPGFVIKASGSQTSIYPFGYFRIYFSDFLEIKFDPKLRKDKHIIKQEEEEFNEGLEQGFYL